MGLLDKVDKQTPKEAHSSKEQPAGKKFVTKLDKIYYKVNEDNDVKLKDLAASLSIPVKQVEGYAKLLDKQGLAKIYYPAIGSARLKSIQQKIEKKPRKNKNLLFFAIIVTIIVAAVVYLLQTGILLNLMNNG